MTTPTDPFARAAAILPNCPNCRENGDEPSLVDRGECEFCDRTLQLITDAIVAATKQMREERDAALAELKTEKVFSAWWRDIIKGFWIWAGVDQVPNEGAPWKVNETNGRIFDMKAERDALRAEVATLRGITPELGPFPPDGEGLPRYGIRWNGPTRPLAVPMADGYWTPWHLADALKDQLERGVGILKWAQSELVGRNLVAILFIPKINDFVHEVEGTCPECKCAIPSGHHSFCSREPKAYQPVRTTERDGDGL